jgi:hypothetical protein
MLVRGNDGTLVVLQNPLIQGDNLVGVELGTPDTVSVPVSEVSEAVVKVKSPKRTILLVGGLTALTTMSVLGYMLGGRGRGCEVKASNPNVVNCPDSLGNVYDDT